MNRLFAAITIATTSLTLAACGPADPPKVTEGAWTIDSDASRVDYVSVKSGEIAETNEFSLVTGSLSEEGKATVEIDLASLETGVDIRNERMRDIFFEIADHPKAIVTADIDPRAYEFLEVGNNTIETVKGTLSVKGVETNIEADVNVTRTGPDRVTVVTNKPVIVMADALELTGGLAQLQEIAGLPSITPAVPVTFSLAFKR
ncbi:MAG: YceI family protein [Pseudomonadota bacterium]